MTFFEHLEYIENIGKNSKTDNAKFLATGETHNTAGGFGQHFASGGTSGTLYSNVFGAIHTTGHPFPIASMPSTHAGGVLHSDVFGNVRVGDSPFISGKINNHASSGDLHHDMFGNIYVGNSPFISGKL